MPEDDTQFGFLAGLRQRWLRVASVAFVLLIIVGAAVWWFVIPHKLDVWKPATVAYTANCGPDCKTLRPIAPGHGGSVPQDARNIPRLEYNPKVDDAVAQWGDCLQSIMVCVEKQSRNNAPAVNACVAQAMCPQACKDRFQSKTGQSIQVVQKALFGTFVSKDAVCRPDEPA